MRTIRTIAVLIALVVASMNSSAAGVFDIPATGAWTKVQDGETTQWSAIPSTQPKMRIDFVSYVEGGDRVSYYLIRSACPDGTVASAVIKPGNKLGIGMDCAGFTVAKTASVLDEVQKLPADAAALLKR